MVNRMSKGLKIIAGIVVAAIVVVVVVILTRGDPPEAVDLESTVARIEAAEAADGSSDEPTAAATTEDDSADEPAATASTDDSEDAATAAAASATPWPHIEW